MKVFLARDDNEELCVALKRRRLSTFLIYDLNDFRDKSAESVFLSSRTCRARTLPFSDIAFSVIIIPLCIYITLTAME